MENIEQEALTEKGTMESIVWMYVVRRHILENGQLGISCIYEIRGTRLDHFLN